VETNGQLAFPSTIRISANLVTPIWIRSRLRVVDPAAGATVKRAAGGDENPTYTADPVTGCADRLQTSNRSVSAERQIPALSCAKVHSGVAYRSKYFAAGWRMLWWRTPQGGRTNRLSRRRLSLLPICPTEMEPDRAGDNDTVEILDQEVSRVVCDHSLVQGPRNATVRAQLGIGGAQTAKGGDGHPYLPDPRSGGANINGIHCAGSAPPRPSSGFAALYASGETSDRCLVTSFSSPRKTPPPADMIVVSPDAGTCGDRCQCGRGAASTFLLQLLRQLRALPRAPCRALLSRSIFSTAAAPRAPSDVADAIIAALPAGFTGQKFHQQSRFQCHQMGRLILSSAIRSGARLAIRNETNGRAPPLALPLFVVRVSIAKFICRFFSFNSLVVHTADMRRNHAAASREPTPLCITTSSGTWWMQPLPPFARGIAMITGL